MFSKGLAELVLYEEVVGLVPEGPAENGWAWFWAGGPERRQRVALHQGTLLFEEHSPLPEGERWGKVHYAFEVPRAKLAAAARHVRAYGVEVYGPTCFDWMRATSYYFYDPDGNLLEFWSPDPEAAAKEKD